jgi:hypothetical protein
MLPGFVYTSTLRPTPQSHPQPAKPTVPRRNRMSPRHPPASHSTASVPALPACGLENTAKPRSNSRSTRATTTPTWHTTAVQESSSVKARSLLAWLCRTLLLFPSLCRASPQFTSRRSTCAHSAPSLVMASGCGKRASTGIWASHHMHMHTHMHMRSPPRA